MFADMLFVLLVGATSYFAYITVKKLPIHWIFAAISLFAYTALLVGYFNYLGDLFPNSIPGWMLSMEELLALPVALLMPALFHSMLILVDRATPLDAHPSVLKTTIGAVAVPAFWYVCLRIIVPMLQGKIDWTLLSNLQTLIFVVLTVAFIFLVLRLTYLLSLKGLWAKPRNVIIVKVIFTGVLPLLSLLVYNGVLLDAFSQFGRSFQFQFIGDWSNPIYYIVVLVNSFALSFPRPESLRPRLTFFVIKAVIYPFVLYFFIVFLPLLPLAVNFIVFFGFGFLLMSPLLLFFFHSKSLYEDWLDLRSVIGDKQYTLVLVAAFVLLPSYVVIDYLGDRFVVSDMLAHVYEPDLSSEKNFEANLDDIRKIIDKIKQAKGSRNWFFENRKPYLETFYQWVVLDNLTLSDKRLSELERVFFAASDIVLPERQVASPLQAPPHLVNVSVATRLAENGAFNISRVDLEIKNEAAFNAEYSVTFRLPVGAWIDDYYLMINGNKVPGILAEKTAAQWIYQQSRNAQRDPGIIYYLASGELMLRIFPFAENETRYSGFEVIHKSDVHFDIDGKSVNLKGMISETPTNIESSQSEQSLLLSQKEKSQLKATSRQPYLHFIIDQSLNSAQLKQEFIARIEKFLSSPIAAQFSRSQIKLTLTGHDSRTYELKENWKETLQNFENTGGFFLQRGIQKSLIRHYTNVSDKYPLFIVVTDNMSNAIFLDDMATFSAVTLPDTQYFYVLDENIELSKRLMADPRYIAGNVEESFDKPLNVLAWPNTQNAVSYLADDGKSSIVFRNPKSEFMDFSPGENAWENGLNLYSMWLKSQLHPNNLPSKQHQIVYGSFQAKILTPLTSYLAPENDAQKKFLLQKQQRVLSSNRILDIEEEFQMDEPPLWLLALLMFSILAIGKRRRQGLLARKRA